MTGAASSKLLVAFVYLEEQLADESFWHSILALQAGLTLVVLMDLKALARLDQKLVAPLVSQAMTALILVAELRHRLALQALQYGLGFSLGVPPVPPVHG
jgi:hypothetical protein